MAIKATFPGGTTSTTTTALHQWDYGQQLEIEHPDLTTIMEAHFACPDMVEAIVRPCSSTLGVATVMIPDRCLEQSSPITVWVFIIDGSEGMTKLTISIPIEARMRPAPTSDIPLNLVNRYTELVTEINESVEGLRNGDIVAAKALSATSAGVAGEANRATTAVAAETLIPPAIVTVNAPICEVLESGLYCFLLTDNTLVYSMIFYVDVTAQGRSQHCHIGNTLDAYLSNAERTITVISSSGAMKIRDYIKVF